MAQQRRTRSTSARSSTRRRSAPSRARRAGSEPSPLDGLTFRSIGPYRGGRVVAVAGDPADRLTFYMGSTGGGVWRTNDGGAFWENVSDGFFKRASVGAIAVAASDPNVIYVGMGEATIRGNVSHGDGVYRSNDRGKTWTHLGLADTRNIGKVRVHPRDPETVYVAALGHAHGPNEERGVFRSRDGGRTWDKVLYRGERAGAIDIALDPNNPRILYATLWEAYRGPHELVSGGPGSGIFRSTDGGDTWTDISRKKGLPKGVLGKIGIAVSPARAERVWAIVEAEGGAVFRSDDGGESWERGSEDRNLRQRAWYYHHIYADPQDAETVWVLNVDAWRSTDGGKTFVQMAIPHGDNHDLWIDPRDAKRMIEGNDGGATVTFNGGETWSSIYNQPTAEFYHVITDTAFPYRVYGAQQDNTAITVPSRSRIAAITDLDAFDIGGGESGYVAIRRDDPNIVYCGSYQGFLTRYDNTLGQARNIMVWPELSSGWGAKDVRHRFQWTFPIVLSPHDDNVLYVTGERVFRSTDEGVSWEAISPDLTRNDVTRLEASGGPITKDNTGAEYYCTIFAFAESPVERGVLWAGSDDGLVHVSRDDGARWQRVKIPGLPEWSLISLIEASPHDAGTAYVAATRYKLDDFRPYIFKTTNYGRTWTKITAGIPQDVFVRAVREDPERPDLLYAGTETGLYVSFDGGRAWQRMHGKDLPVVPIHDLVVHEGDLVLGTHGRSFWILDDLTAVREWSERVRREPAHLFPPRPTYRMRSKGGFPGKPIAGKNYRFTDATMLTYRLSDHPETGEKVETYLDAGKNPPDGVVVSYWLREKPEGEVTLAFLDARGREIKSFSSRKDEQKPLADAPEAALPSEGAETASELRPSTTDAAEAKQPRVPKDAGLNRFIWNMRYEDAAKVEDDKSMEEFERALAGPVATPGRYQVRLTVGGEPITQPFEIRKDPRVPASQADFDAQFQLLLRIRDKISEAHETVTQIRATRSEVEAWERRAARDRALRPIVRAAAKLRKELTAIEDEIIQSKAKSRQDTLNFPIKLNAKLAGLAGVIASADAAPTRSSYEVFEHLAGRIDEEILRFRSLAERDVAAFNALLRRSAVPAVVGVRAPAARRERGGARKKAAAAAH